MTPTTKLRDETMEWLSDKVRKGEPVSFLEAIAVINYQETLRREREANSWAARVKRWIRATIKAVEGERL